MLIALLTVLLLGGGSDGALGDIATAQDQLKIYMEKGDDQKGAKSVLKNMTKRTKARNKLVKSIYKEINADIADYEGSNNAVMSILGEYQDEREQYQLDMIDLRFELKQHVSREDWGKIYSIAEQ